MEVEQPAGRLTGLRFTMTAGWQWLGEETAGRQKRWPGQRRKKSAAGRAERSAGKYWWLVGRGKHGDSRRRSQTQQSSSPRLFRARLADDDLFGKKKEEESQLWMGWNADG